MPISIKGQEKQAVNEPTISLSLVSPSVYSDEPDAVDIISEENGYTWYVATIDRRGITACSLFESSVLSTEKDGYITCGKER